MLKSIEKPGTRMMKRLTWMLLVLVTVQTMKAQFVKADGTILRDGNGQELFLTGMNLGNWLLWEGYLMMGDFNYRTHTQFFNSVKSAFGNDLAKAMEFEHQWRLNYVNEQAIIDLKNRGFNSVRVPFNFNLFWDYGTNAVSNRGFQYFDQVINYCRTHGLYVLLDMHAAPGYQNPGDHSDNVDSNASQPRETVRFWDGNNVQIAAQVWKHIANYYKNEPVVWGYDLINEPVPQPGREFELLASMVTMRNAIREVDNNHVIVAEGSWWGSDMQKLDWMDSETRSKTGITARWDNNLVYQTHHYSSDVSLLNGRLAICNKLNVPMILGEYGESDNGNLRNMTDWCITNKVGYFPWSFKKMSHDRCLWTIHPNSAYESLKNFINNGGTPPANIYNDMISFCKNNIANGAPGITYHQDFYDAVKNTSLNACSNGSAVSLPAKIQAEAYCLMSGIQTENTSDTGGGQNVGWIDAGDWIDFRVNVAQAGDFKLSLRVAADGTASKRIELRKGTAVAGTVTFNATGGWQNWQTHETTVSLSAGYQTLRIYFPVSGINLNWLEFGVATATTFTQTIQAENYFEMSGVQTENTSDTGGGLNVGWIDNGDWMGYAINLPQAGTYTVEYRVASPNSNGQLSLEAFGGGTVYGTRTIPNTGGWQNWTTVSHTVTLPAGNQNLGLAVQSGGWNINWLRVTLGTLKSASQDGATAASSSTTVSIYPNPVESVLHINAVPDDAQVHIVDATGRVVKSFVGALANVEELPRGLYVLLVDSPEVMVRLKFVKH